MADALWLLTKDDIRSPNQSTVNGITSCLINSDDANTSDQVKQQAATLLRQAGHKVTDSYFSNAVIVSDLASGPLAASGSGYVLGDCATELV